MLVPSRFGLRPGGACGHPAGEEEEWHPLAGTEGPASGSQNRAWLSTQASLPSLVPSLLFCFPLMLWGTPPSQVLTPCGCIKLCKSALNEWHLLLGESALWEDGVIDGSLYSQQLRK